jgi:hypothetical protein
MMSVKVGMNTQSKQCSSIRGKTYPGERCPCKPLADSEWCGKHKTTKIRFQASDEKVEHIPMIPSPRRSDISVSAAVVKIRRVWSRWLARRAGPLLWFREESNNPDDFFSADPVKSIPLANIVSFVAEGKGYIMDIQSAISLIEHATTAKELPLNPFNRAPLPALFLKRIAMRTKTKKAWAVLQPMSEAQKLVLATTDVFRLIEDLGYYTDPSWFVELTRLQLQRFYIELADIWFHRAALTPQDRHRIVPGPRGPFGVPVTTAMIMQQKALRPLLLNTCRELVSVAENRADRQLGVMYLLGSLSIVSAGAGVAYPWLVDMFSPGVSWVVGNGIVVQHPTVMGY